MNRTRTPESDSSVRRSFSLALLLTCGLMGCIFATHAQDLTPDPSKAVNVQPLVSGVVVSPVSHPSSVAGVTTVAPVNAAEMIHTAPTRPAVPASVTNFLGAYLPTRDTNVAVGIGYPPGSTDFIHMAAGKPRLGDPRLPPPVAGAESTLAPIVSTPLYTYELADRGASSVLIRRSQVDVIYDFPPGSFARVASATAESTFGGLVPYPVRATTASGTEYIENFPPGARVVGSVPVATPK